MNPLTWITVVLAFGVPFCFNLMAWRQWVRESGMPGLRAWRRRALACAIAANTASLVIWASTFALALAYGPVFDFWGWSADAALALLGVSLILLILGHGQRRLSLLSLALTFALFTFSVPAIL